MSVIAAVRKQSGVCSDYILERIVGKSSDSCCAWYERGRERIQVIIVVSRIHFSMIAYNME